MAVFVNFRLIGKNKCIFFKHPSKYKLKNVNTVKFYSRSSSAEPVQVVVPLGNGQKLKITMGKMARTANRSVTASIGNTVAMATAMSKKNKAKSTFFPLTVNYRPKEVAARRIHKNKFWREIDYPTVSEILTSRIIDRSVRPLFPKEFNSKINIICNMRSLDGTYHPDVVAINAASAALAVSDIPWDGPVGAVRIGFIDNEVVINPTEEEMHKSILNLVVCATRQNTIVMLEGTAEEIACNDLQKAIKTGAKECQNIANGIQDLRNMYGKAKRPLPPQIKTDINIVNKVKELGQEKLTEIFTNYEHNKASRDHAIMDLKNEILESFKSLDTKFNGHTVNKEFDKLTKEIFRSLIFENDVRCDGRKFTELRPINCAVDLPIPFQQGCALFQQGHTQVLCTVTLDSITAPMKLDTNSMMTSGTRNKKFCLHYKFPPYATNEIGRSGFFGRREVDHGALAQQGLMAIFPKDYPFTVGLTSEVLESNGSSSMASVCGGSLALLDAGVPITSSAGGIAVGLVTRTNPMTNEIIDYRILTDILDVEEYMGDMDFKLAGTNKGVNAIQADIKLPGLPLKIFMESLLRATQSKNEIIDIMNRILAQPKVSKKNMPVTKEMKIHQHLQSEFVGTYGENLRTKLLEIGVQIDRVDEHTYVIFAANKEALIDGRELVDTLLETQEALDSELDGMYTAEVIEITENGIIVIVDPNPNPGITPIFIHNSQLEDRVYSYLSDLGIDVGERLEICMREENARNRGAILEARDMIDILLEELGISDVDTNVFWMVNMVEIGDNGKVETRVKIKRKRLKRF